MIDVYSIFKRIGENKPLVHHITNWVTIYDCANMTRAFGALPVMAHAKEEVEQMVGISSALVLNIGTLTIDLVDTMIVAAKAANKKGIPVIMDAVGVGATDLRTTQALRIMKEARVDILKGNYGEIGVLAGAKAEVKGVESMGVEGDPVEIAKGLAKIQESIVVMTGEKDIIAGPDVAYVVANGHEMMGSVVGTGCMAASVIGSFAAVEKDYAKATAAALACYGIAGELAAQGAKGPGTFKEAFYDAVWNLKGDAVAELAKVEMK